MSKLETFQLNFLCKASARASPHQSKNQHKSPSTFFRSDIGCFRPFLTCVQVLQDDGEEAYFAAFEAHDGDNFRCVDEDGFVDAIETLAPGR